MDDDRPPRHPEVPAVAEHLVELRDICRELMAEDSAEFPTLRDAWLMATGDARFDGEDRRAEAAKDRDSQIWRRHNGRIERGRPSVKSGGINIPTETRRRLRREGRRCAYCRGLATSIDHVYPRARGGDHDISNLVPACQSCNREKLDKTVEEWRVVRQQRGQPWPPEPYFPREVVEHLKRRGLWPAGAG